MSNLTDNKKVMFCFMFFGEGSEGENTSNSFGQTEILQ